MTAASKFLPEIEKRQVEEAIKEAEKNTSGEIRVHIENSCKGDVLDQAAYIFKKLQMNKTELRNGVLFYLAIKNKQFAILGDAGINQKVQADFWDQTRDIVLDEFAKENYGEGLAKGILQAGQQLKKYFPHQTNDVNELSDEISFGK